MNADLIARLAAGATLVTPNRRLAQHYKDSFDAAQRAAGLTVWPSADILPCSAFVTRCFDHVVETQSAAGGDSPILLSAEQAMVLWDQAVARAAVDAGLLSAAQTAAQCASAWSLAHAWGLWPRMKSVPLSDDARAFAAWADAYEAQCRRTGCIDDARLPAWLMDKVAGDGWNRPAHLLLAGFELRTAAQNSLLTAFAAAGTVVEEVEPTSGAAAAARVACADAAAELAAAARWARARLLENPQARVGVVVPDLAERREEVLRRFALTLRPAADDMAAVDVSLGVALSEWPLVHDALLLLDAARARPLPFAEWSGLIRSPFLGGAGQEASMRARLDAALRENCLAEETIEGITQAMTRNRVQAPALLARLTAFKEVSADAPAQRIPPSDWGRRFTHWLKAAGFPGDRSLDSIEHQTLARFRALLEGLSALDRVVPRMTLADALARIRRLAGETLFQPEQAALPVQALGILESAGIAFDHLWVSGLTADAWPLAARPHPFLPVVLQREAGIPEASADAALAVDRRITAGWVAAAKEVVFSHALRDGDRELLPSPLIAEVPQVDLPSVVPAAELDDAARMLATRRLESLQDDVAPGAVLTAPLASGTAALRDQAACPFRAHARHRLHAVALAEPEPGLDAMQRGTLLHAVLQRVWTELQDQATLLSQDDVALTALVRHATDHVLTQHRVAQPLRATPRLARIESARLVRLVRLWLEVEKTRAPFRVEAMEEKRVVQAGALPLNVRLDRMDRVLDGEMAGRAMVIDYKTGKSSVASWDGERPDEPQLPLYLLADAEDVAALAFAQVRLDDMGFKGLAAAPGIARGIGTPEAVEGETPAAAWQRRVNEWRGAITALGDAFIAGQSAVDPKSSRACEQCDLHRLCRVADRIDDADVVDGAGAVDE